MCKMSDKEKKGRRGSKNASVTIRKEVSEKGWCGYVEECLACEECEIWQVVRVKKRWDASKAGGFICGICTSKKMNARMERIEKMLNECKRMNEIEESIAKLNGEAKKLKEDFEKDVKEFVKEKHESEEKSKRYADMVKKGLDEQMNVAEE